jgi:hypothetical protein
MTDSGFCVAGTLSVTVALYSDNCTVHSMRSLLRQ